MKAIWQQFMLPIIGGGLGLILAILFVTIGFFKTLLLIILTALGIAVGLYLKRTGLLDDLIERKNN
ncbi:hypothetical protein FC84_GL001522 [Lapidilactobacillus dextrinicus DSM 20335]|uniref:DUF2273 domain-containing protein n=1 Tax=Lapidilactobacillus dextrinicus DSM 20335 TaxID=1423738 RepID=A0A0R2BV10_9LACO|nr:DUF2273 domain-containing protein [Lapidilactobacillus dextrinicus]KRM79347.1 hypothetical protein FC84_GL001522 [Lapidilactobacillus dextrinicus DSM 20335]QFG46819.1 DUF2273 domain-containing protein [Lapidilactobacillus dextrinicus]